MVEDVWAPAVAEHPAIDRVVSFPKRTFRSIWRSPRVALQAARWLWALRARKYDLVIDAQGLARSGLMSWITGAPVRVVGDSCREFSWLGANRRVSSPRGSHVVDSMLQLAAAVGANPAADMRLAVPSADVEWWNGERKWRGIDGPLVVFATANGWAGKRWIPTRWQQLLQIIAPDLSRHGIHDVVWIGAPGEEDQVAWNQGCESLPTPLRSHNLSGLTSVGGTMAVVKSASLVVALDSAPAHLAIGLGVPVVALYGATDPNTDGPYQAQEWCAHGGRGFKLDRHDYRSATKGGEMMARISVEEVATLIRKRLLLGAES